MKKTIWNLPGFQNLSGFACFSTAILSAIALFLWHKREHDIRSKTFYEDSIKIWKGSETAKFLIGEPIKLKHVEFFNPANYISDEKAKFFIPFSGKNYNGKINVNATCKDDKWTLHELSLELNKDLKDKKFILFREKKGAKSSDGEAPKILNDKEEKGLNKGIENVLKK